MKKSLIMIAAAAFIFAGCAGNDTFKRDLRENTGESSGAIGFTSFTEKVTKAENSDALYSWSFYDHQETFQVWARKNNQPTKEIFEGDTVFVTKESGVYKYKYAPDRYWDKLAEKYYFYAAAPAPAEGAEWKWEFNAGGITNAETIDKGYFTIEDNKFSLNGVNLQSVENGKPSDALKNSFKTATNNSIKDVDLLIADETPVARSFYNKANPEAVNLNFIHILSKLNITVSTSLDKTGNNKHVVDLLAFEVKNVPNTGSFDESKTMPNNKKAIRWTLDDAPSKIAIPTGIDAYNATTYAIDDNSKVAVPHTTDGKKYIVESLIIPQEIKYQRVALDGKAHDAVNENTAVPFASYEAYEIARHNDVERLTEAQFDALFATKYTTLIANFSDYKQVSENIDQATFNERVAEATDNKNTPDDNSDDAPYTDFNAYTTAKGNNATLNEAQFTALLADGGGFKSWNDYTQVVLENINEAEFKRRKADATATPETHILAYDIPTEPYFIITYSVDGVVYTGNYNLAAAFLGYNNDNKKYVSGELTDLDLDGADDNDDPTTFGFYEGWQNTLNIIIQPTAIKFTADVAKWSDNTEADYEIEKGNENPNN